jgi:hypothetical protein
VDINKSLVRAIAGSGLDFEDVAIFAGILTPKLISFIQGKDKPDVELKKRLSIILDKPSAELWPNG